jgi:signal transduction histidine kinase
MQTAVDVQALFDALGQENQDGAEQAGIELRIAPTSAAVVSDAIILKSILRNLVRNALKYTPPGGRVLIGCRRSGLQFRIEVHDTGTGIPDHALEQIFDAFRRLDSAASDGLGLGLFVVRRAADLLGHKVEVHSEIGRGSCFAVLAKAAQVPSKPSELAIFSHGNADCLSLPYFPVTASGLEADHRQ